MIAPLYCCNEYKVDSDGFIISKRDHKPMKSAKNQNGYSFVSIVKEGKKINVLIHIAVAKAFLGDKINDGLQVNHKDGNKDNNCVDNLEWVTPKENMRHSVDVLGHNVGTNNGNAKSIKGYDKNTGKLLYSFGSIADCAREISPNNNYRQIQNSIWRVLSGKRKSYKGCIWEYVD